MARIKRDEQIAGREVCIPLYTGVYKARCQLGAFRVNGVFGSPNDCQAMLGSRIFHIPLISLSRQQD